MKKLFLLILISLFLGFLLFWGQKKIDFISTSKSDLYPLEILDKNDQLIANFKVELSQTEEERLKGLMKREHLPADQGMIFIYGHEQPLSFWMKDTLIPLDIIYLDKNKTIVKIIHRALPCEQITCPGYPSVKPAQYVLEINADLSKKLEIKEGMKVEFNLSD